MDLHFWRQIFILIATLIPIFASGFITAFPGILNPSILNPNGTDIRATMDQASWIAAATPMSGVLGCIILPIIMQMWGRRVTALILSLCPTIGWIIFFFAKSIAALFVARIIQGFVFGSLIVASLITSEYSHPKRRGYFMVLKKVTQTFGVLMTHVLALFWSWRTVAGFCVLIHVPGIVMILFWPESPAFLAMKGRFEDCERSYVWLFGNSKENVKELNDLIATQKERLNKTEKESISSKIKRTMKNLLMKDFQKAFLISILLSVITEASGRYLFMVYVVQIIMELVADKTKAVYISILNDCFILIALCLAGVVVRRVKRRTILMGFGAFTTALMLLISIVLIVKDKIVFANADLWSVGLILILCFVSHIGVIPAAFAVFGEVFSLEHRGLGTSFTVIVLICIFGITLKLSPVLMESVGLSGMFLVCCSCASVSLVILYFILPETNGRTLQDIEFEMKGVVVPLVVEQEKRPILSK